MASNAFQVSFVFLGKLGQLLSNTLLDRCGLCSIN